MADLASPSAVRLARPRWLDLRLAGGVALLVISVLGVTAVISGADTTTSVWVAAHPLAAGSVVGTDDVRAEPVHLASTSSSGVYLTSGSSLTGKVVVRAVGTNELIPATALTSADAAPPRRLVTVAVARFHLPADLHAGDVVDVYLVPGAVSGALPGGVGAPRLVLSDVIVSSVDDSGSGFGGSADVGVALAVSPPAVPNLVGAAAHGALTLVAVPDGAIAVPAVPGVSSAP